MFGFQGGNITSCTDKRSSGDDLEATIARLVAKAVAAHTQGLADQAQVLTRRAAGTEDRLDLLEQAVGRIQEQAAATTSNDLQEARAEEARRRAEEARAEVFEQRLQQASRAREELATAAAAADARITAVERVFVDLKSQRSQAATSEQVHEVGRRLLEMRSWLDESRLQARVAEVEKRLKGHREDQEGAAALRRRVEELAAGFQERSVAARAQADEVGARLLEVSGRLGEVEAAGPLRPEAAKPRCKLDEAAAPASCSESTCSDEASRQLGVRVESLERAVQDSGGRLFKAEVACRELRQRALSLAEQAGVDRLAAALTSSDALSQERFDELAGLVRNMGAQVKVAETSCAEVQKKLFRLADREHVEAVENKLEDVAASLAPLAPEPGEDPQSARLRAEVHRTLGDVVGRVRGMEATCTALQGSHGGHHLLSRVEELEEAMANAASARRGPCQPASELAPAATAWLDGEAAVHKGEALVPPLDLALIHCHGAAPVTPYSLESEEEPPPLEPDGQGSKAPPGPGGPLGGPLAERQAPDAEWLLGASAWDAAVLVGAPGVGRAGSLLLVALTGLTATAQIIFVAVVFESYSGAVLGPSDAEALAQWRIGAGQGVFAGGATLAERVCSSVPQPDVASPGKSLASLMNSYLGEHLRGSMASGPALCVVACLCWHACALREVRSALALSRGLLALPRGETSWQSSKEGTWLRSLSSARLAFGVAICAARLFLLWVLTCCGTMFLVATLDAPEMLLRGLAARAVLEVGDLLVSAAAPPPFAKNSQLPAGAASPQRELVEAAVRFAALAAGGLLTWFLLIEPQLDAVEESAAALCGAVPAH